MQAPVPQDDRQQDGGLGPGERLADAQVASTAERQERGPHGFGGAVGRPPVRVEAASPALPADLIDRVMSVADTEMERLIATVEADPRPATVAR